jgi:hypothetical protein
LKQFKSKNTFLDNYLSTVYAQFFYPNNLLLVLSVFVFGFFDHYRNLQEGGLALTLEVAGDLCTLVAFVVVTSFFFIGFIHLFGSYKKNKVDVITFEEDFYSVANPSRELKWFWKDVVACRASDYQIIISNPNNIHFQLSHTGLSEEEWKEINEIVRSKVKTSSLWLYTNLIILTAFIGCIQWVRTLINLVINHS